MAFAPFTINIEPGSSTGNEIERLIGKAIASNPAAAAQYLKMAEKAIDKARLAALRVTAARLRKRLVEAFADNTLGWVKHGVYSKFAGGAIPIAQFLKANRARQVLGTSKTAKSKMSVKELARLGRRTARAAAGSARAQKELGFLNPPKQYPIGGRFVEIMRYATDKDSLTVGVLSGVYSKEAQKLKKFQDGGLVTLRGSIDSMRRYFGALGMPIRRNPLFEVPKRPLFEPIQSKYPPDKLFESAFIDILTGKLEARD